VVDLALGGTVMSRGACVVFMPSAFIPAASGNELQVTVPPGGLRIATAGGPATIAVRRFAAQFQAIGTVSGSAGASLRIGSDRAASPWHVRVVASQRATVCGLG
jgi:hypothetical protein